MYDLFMVSLAILGPFPEALVFLLRMYPIRSSIYVTSHGVDTLCLEVVGDVAASVAIIFLKHIYSFAITQII